MKPSGSPVADRHHLADALRELREGRELSLEQAAAQALDASGAKLSRIENARQVPAPRDVRDLCQLYRVPARRTAELVALATTARATGWWESYDINDDDYVGLEDAATHIDQFASSFVPGLLQTPRYAEAFLSRIINPDRTRPWKDREIQQWLAVHAHRQALLEPGSGVQLVFVLDEASLMRAVGGKTMRDQITHLMTMAERPNIVIRVLPFSTGASPGQRGPFNILTLSASAGVAYSETQTGFVLTKDADEVSRFRTLFDIIREASADETRTQELLGQAMTRLP